ncbi:MAG: gliding motility-associated C-terminal domain-containing protein [Bacteroidales bacterium]|nr:gliding motility-associated C-terminal domain-containing protein [Bacteroidales bacterium]
MRVKLIVIFLILSYTGAYATHNRAGEITYKQISELTYEVTITTFTYVLSLADRDALEVEWGDNTSSIASRIEKQELPNYYQRNVYKIIHTYPGAGVYKIVVQDPNRNHGIENIPNSVNVVFSISTILLVNPAMGFNSTPVLLNPPYDKAALGHRFIHNPAAWDADGDSISYALTVCTRDDGIPIENYTLPPASTRIWVDSISGDLIWDSPTQLGKYNVAIEINEWRDGYKIGTVIRDMQIEVYETDNNPPINGPLNNFCIEAGETIDFAVVAFDEDGDEMTLYATSGLFTISECLPTFDSISSIAGLANYNFSWTACHETVRDQPYDVLIKAEDNNPEIELFDIDNFTVKVLGPAPVLNSGSPQGKFVKLDWAPYVTDIIRGYNIYRRESPSTFVPDSCTNGIPEYLEFEKVAYVQGFSILSYIDRGDGDGLEEGIQYSYRIVAVYPNFAESKSSNEISTSLISGVPVIVEASIMETDVANGKVSLKWLKPTQLDTIPGAVGPYEILIYRSEGIVGENYQYIHTITDLNDTTLIDSMINTLDYGYIYMLELYNATVGNRFLIGDPGVASTPFITLSPGDKKVNIQIDINVPWINTAYTIFRYNDIGMVWDSVGITNVTAFTDAGLINGQNYCFKILSQGEYMTANLPDSLFNNSQEACIMPYDNEAPCTPELHVSTNCDSLYNYLRWELEDSVCYEDVIGYYIYYKGNFGDDLSLLIDIDNRDIMEYKHDNLGDLVSGCYAISAYDLNGNVSPRSLIICVDSCNYYEIPNVFTPNSDGKNDLLLAKTTGLIDKVEFKLFNRTGILVFSTDDPDLNWNGTYKGKLVGPGVYFYQCDVFENRITGLEQYHLSGFIHVITEKGSKPIIIEY